MHIFLDILRGIVTIIIAYSFVFVAALVNIWFERRFLAFMQDRLGPMYVGGWHGWAQTIADSLKLFLKEDIIPEAADKVLFVMAPYIAFLGAFAAFVVLPFGAASIVSDLNIGILYIVAVGSLAVVGIMKILYKMLHMTPAQKTVK
jgi:NADH-quinone oxidoreductase subunit H